MDMDIALWYKLQHTLVSFFPVKAANGLGSRPCHDQNKLPVAVAAWRRTPLACLRGTTVWGIRMPGLVLSTGLDERAIRFVASCADKAFLHVSREKRGDVPWCWRIEARCSWPAMVGSRIGVLVLRLVMVILVHGAWM